MTIENDLNNFETFVSNEFGNRQILLTGEGPPSLTSGASSTVGIGAFYIDNVTRKRYERKETDWELFYDESGAGLYGQWNQITSADSNPEYDIITGGENILADTELGEITLRLPPNPNELDLIIIVPLKPTYEFNNLKINANGSSINGDSSGDLIVLSEPNLSVQLIYVGGDAGWAFFRLGDSVVINRESNSGTFLQKVFTDEQLDPGNGSGLLGEGTASNPLSIETGKFIEEIESTTDFTGTGKSGSPLTLNTLFIDSVVSDSDFTGTGVSGDPLKLANTYLQTVQTTNDLTGTGSSANKLALSTAIKNDISTAVSDASSAITATQSTDIVKKNQNNSYDSGTSQQFDSASANTFNLNGQDLQEKLDDLFSDMKTKFISNNNVVINRGIIAQAPYYKSEKVRAVRFFGRFYTFTATGQSNGLITISTESGSANVGSSRGTIKLYSGVPNNPTFEGFTTINDTGGTASKNIFIQSMPNPGNKIFIEFDIISEVINGGSSNAIKLSVFCPSSGSIIEGQCFIEPITEFL